MNRIVKVCFVLVLFVTGISSVVASGGGSASKTLEGMYPIVLSHGLFGWGEDSTGAINLLTYWGGMDDYLRSEGAVVYSPSKTAMESNAFRGVEFNTKVLSFMAANGYNKVHILGHSQGGLDSRYAITHLGLSSKVSTLTTLNSPHRGTPLADLIRDVVPDWLKPYAAVVLNSLASLIYNKSEQNALAILSQVTISGQTSFNAQTPNISGVKYYSYGSYITLPDLIQHPILGLLQPACVAGGIVYGVGASCDGIVSYSSQKWGNWMGGPDYGVLVTGIDHIQATNALYSGQAWYDVKGYFLKMAKNMKMNQ
ncbi:esterase/lipase family protein [Leptospira saintgironsiae]|uniref:Lipase n=1 Tax=Leptospira saintgironsiae TaxID=2023183 RepID=A0A2M9Y7H9_9LEPT|nr:alpha/beta fold hydrolase [Leptospira saintgironsiae]PJZ47511.1 lipase [Leptospira saintgironsiae]